MGNWGFSYNYGTYSFIENETRLDLECNSICNSCNIYIYTLSWKQPDKTNAIFF